MKNSQSQKNIPSDWQQVKLGDVLSVGSGKDYKHLDTGDIPVFGTGGYMLSVNKPLHSGETVFVGRKGTIDKPFYFKGDFWTVDTLFYTHKFKNTTAKYINNVFQKIDWKSYNEASGVPSLSKTTIEKIKISLPSLPEQNRIISVLETWDNAIEKLSKKIEVKKQIKKGLMQDLLTGKKRLKGFSNKWKQVILNDVMSSFSTGLNPRDNFKLGFGKNYYVTIKNISNGRLDFSSAEKVDDLALKLINKRSKLSKNDIIMSSIGNVGESYLLKEDPKGWDINESVFCLKPNIETIDPKFLYFIIVSSETKKYFENNITGSSFRSIKMKELKNMPIIIPEINEQNAIAEILTTAEDEIQELEKKLQIIKEQKKYLLNNLITGRIRTPETLSTKLTK